MSIHALGISRFFQRFEFADAQALDDNMMEDVRVLAPMHIRGEVERLFVTPLFRFLAWSTSGLRTLCSRSRRSLTS